MIKVKDCENSMEVYLACKITGHNNKDLDLSLLNPQHKQALLIERPEFIDSLDVSDMSDVQLGAVARLQPELEGRLPSEKSRGL